MEEECGETRRRTEGEGEPGAVPKWAGAKIRRKAPRPHEHQKRAQTTDKKRDDKKGEQLSVRKGLKLKEMNSRSANRANFLLRKENKGVRRIGEEVSGIGCWQESNGEGPEGGGGI